MEGKPHRANESTERSSGALVYQEQNWKPMFREQQIKHAFNMFMVLWRAWIHPLWG
jgi:hypothetical protein